MMRVINGGKTSLASRALHLETTVLKNITAVKGWLKDNPERIPEIGEGECFVLTSYEGGRHKRLRRWIVYPD
jgi:hypothetical protein